MVDKANFSSELSKCEQSKSSLKVMTLVIPWLRDTFHLKPKPIAISYNCFAHLITLKTFLFNNSTCVDNNCVKFERQAWPYPPCINCLLIYKMPYPSYRFEEASFLSLEILPVSYTDHTQLTCTCNYIWLYRYGYYQCFFTISSWFF